MRIFTSIVGMSFLMAFLSACETTQPVPEAPGADLAVQEEELIGSEPSDPSEILIQRSDQLLAALEVEDYEALINSISEEDASFVGISFDTRIDIHEPAFTREDLVIEFSEVANPAPNVFGVMPSGESVEMILKDFIQTYWIEPDFLNLAEKEVFEGTNPERAGASMDNTLEFFEDVWVVEYYLPPSEEYGGLDWKNLRFVYLAEEGDYQLVAITRDNWAP